MIFFTLYSRSYCHLCEDMHEALIRLMGDIPHCIEIIDIDLNIDLVNLYDELVPVLFASRGERSAQSGKQLCHYFLDVEQVRAFCE